MLNNNISRWQRKNRLLSADHGTNELQGHSVTRDMIKLGMIGFAVVSIILAIVVGFSGCAQASVISNEQGIRSVMGEAESQSMEGMVAVSYALINRGTLNGVYGFKNVVFKDNTYYKRVSLNSKYYKRTHKRLRPIPNSVYEQAQEAWNYAVSNPGKDNTGHATGWGNYNTWPNDIYIFKQQSWWQYCHTTVKVGDHWFYRCDR